MWRLIVVTFGFLALAFYELSGGADYAAIEQSIQRQGIGPHPSERQADVPTFASLPVKTENDTDLSQRVEATLAALPVTRTETAPTPEPTQAEKIAALTAGSDDAGLPADADEAAVIAALQEAGAELREASTGAIALIARAQRDADTQRLLNSEPETRPERVPDIRVVEGDLVNMRDGPGTEFQKLTSLTGGTEVVVLNAPGNGWLELEVVETGQVGWMADWLVSAAFDTPDVATTAGYSDAGN
ncbi:MAG: SH3 domain-containing protein [Pseudomonadota bacterium]